LSSVVGRGPLIHRVLAGALIALGYVILVGWITRQAWILQPFPQMTAMVASVALCFVLTGIALLGAGGGGEGDVFRRAVVRTLAVVLIAIPSLILIQTPFSIPQLFDWTQLHAWLDDGNPWPGRMAPNSCLAFILEGVVLFLFTRPNLDLGNRAIPIALLVLSLIGGTGLVGYWLDTDLVFSRLHLRMALPTSLGILAMAACSWGIWRQRVSPQPAQPVDRIVGTSAVILVGMALTAGLSGFAILEAQTRSANTDLLEQALHARVAMFEEVTREARADGASLAKLPGLIEAPHKPSAHASASARADLAREKIAAVLRNAVADGFRAMTVTSATGEQLAQQGLPVAVSRIVVPLDDTASDRSNNKPDASKPEGATHAWLLWDNGLVLRTTAPIRASSGSILGAVTAERALPGLTAHLNDVGGFGKTAEVFLCAAGAGRMQCFTNPQGADAYVPNLATAHGRASPMALALTGASGTITALDERDHEVIAAYAPIASGRMGIVIKQDTAEIYAPIRDRLLWMIPIMAALVGLGLLLLRAKVRPLAIRLANSELANREAHDEIAAIVRGIADGLITVDESSCIVSANPAAERIFGYASADLIGRDFNELLPVEFRAARSGGLRRYITDGTKRVVDVNVALVGLRSDGSQFPIELSVDAIRQSGGYRYVGIVRDATAREKAGQALMFEKERLRVTLHSIGDAVITTDTRGVITYLNPVAEHLTGWLSAEAIGQRIDAVYAIVHAAFGDKAPSPVDFVLTTGAIGGMSGDTILMRHDGTRVDVEDSASPIRDGSGTIVGVVLVFHDATQARRLTGHINHQATHDALTDLMNRREFERQLAATLAGDGPQNHGHILLFIDLDQFKIVNDTAGHAAGDKLLKQVAGLLKSCLRSSDQLARMGGDEFAVLLRDCPSESGMRVAESLRQVVADIRFDWDGALFRIGASIGLVHFEAGASQAQVLSEADGACYLAKDKGRNRIYVHHAGAEDVVRRSGELNWTSRIHAALAEDRFVLFAQKIAPVIGTRNKEMHYEMLVRMLDEHGELVPPMAFIPAAERYGLMPSIDRWAVANALKSLSIARARGAKDLLFSINLSGTTLGDDGFVEYVEDQLRIFKVPHEKVCFEITETAAISNLIQAGRFIDRLKQKGCMFSLDDFGTGMSSFTYLKHLPLDFLKIDGSFVRNICKDEVDSSMVDAINRVGHVMGIKTIAEFVEDDAILQRLRFIGVDFAQGYGIEAPRPLSSIIPSANGASGGKLDPATGIDVPSERPRIVHSTSSRWNAR
jgi:diguanylate cyclase (GGDEF)-like protein/PAS domain S-box-containing protein